MRRRSWEEMQEEISLGKKIYPDLNDAEEMLSAVLQAEKDFYRENTRAMEPVHFGWTGEGIKQKFKDDQHLEMDKLQVETGSFKNLLAALVETLVQVNPGLEEAAGELSECMERQLPVISEYTGLEEIKKLFNVLEKETSLERDLATFLFQVSLSSLFQRRLEYLLTELDTSMWRRGDCPVCSQKPHYGLIRKEDGAKVLECWLCGTRWQHMRVKCPFCDNENQEELGLFTAAKIAACRVHFCKSCNSYYKIFDLREYQKKEANLFVHQMATLSHDLLAQKEGFSPGSGLEWVSPIELGVNNNH